MFVEVDDREGAAGYVRAGRPGDLAAKAEETFDAALGVVRSVATGLVGQVQEMRSAISRVEDRVRVATLDVGVAGDPLRFSPDSKLPATDGSDGVTLQRFDAPRAAQHLCAVVGREITRQEWADHVGGRGYQPVCP